VVYGVPFEDCVLQTIDGFIRRKYKTFLVEDAIKETPIFNTSDMDKTLRELTENGVNIITTDIVTSIKD